jgi:hypothetical protein
MVAQSHTAELRIEDKEDESHERASERGGKSFCRIASCLFLTLWVMYCLFASCSASKVKDVSRLNMGVYFKYVATTRPTSTVWHNTWGIKIPTHEHEESSRSKKWE